MKQIIVIGVFIIIGWSCKKKTEIPKIFQIQKDFDLTLVAKEPQVFDPVDMEFDASGNAFVLEMPGYPDEKEESTIVSLQDLDGDGIYETRKIFADSLRLASSFLSYKAGFLVAAPPYLFYVYDVNADGKADKIDTLMGGFSSGNLQHNYNGLTYGLDNYIYAVNGGNSGAPYWWNDTLSKIDINGMDFRFNIIEKKLETTGHSSGGFGLGMDEYDRMFETHNLKHISNLIYSNKYSKNKNLIPSHALKNISYHEENGLARIYPIGEQESRVNHPEQSGYFSGSCGIMYYGGGALGDAYNHTVWVADVVLNLVHVDKIFADSSTFKAKRILEGKDFLASRDRSFRPVNMTIGPDGNIYLIDMHRSVIEHPEWIPDEIEKDMDLDAGKDKGRIYKISLSGHKRQEFAKLDGVDKCIAALSNKNQWVRKTAHRKIMEATITSSQMESIIQLLDAKEELTRLHAMRILAAKNRLTKNSLIKMLLDPVSGVKEHALQLAEAFMEEEEVFGQSLDLLNNENDRLSLQAALSLSTMKAPIEQRRQEMIIDKILTRLTKPIDTWQIQSLAILVSHFPMTFLEKYLQSASKFENLLLINVLRNAELNENQTVALFDLLKNNTRKIQNMQMIIDAYAQNSLTYSNPNNVERAIIQLESQVDAPTLASLAKLREKLDLPQSEKFMDLANTAIFKIGDKGNTEKERLDQISLLELLSFDKKEKVLFDCLGHSQPLALQKAALSQIYKANGKNIGKRLVTLWPQLSPEIRKIVGDILLYKPENHDALLSALEKKEINIGEMNFDLERRRTLLWWTDNEQTKARARKLFSDSGVVTRKQAIDKMYGALSLKGNQQEGKLVFSNLCASCHKYGDLGNEVGPVLTEIQRKSKATLLNDILDPNAAVDFKYISHKVITKDGLTHIGIVESDNDSRLIIKKMGGELVEISKKNIESFISLGSSFMMEGFEGNLTNQNMADLLAFLQNQSI